MSDTNASLTRKIGSAGDLQSVVRTMKAVAASSVGQYEQSVLALRDYFRTVELALGVCVRELGALSPVATVRKQDDSVTVGAIVFGSDQGLVGQFNEVVADYAIQRFAERTRPVEIWAVGERVHARLSDAGRKPIGLFSVPESVKGIAPGRADPTPE